MWSMRGTQVALWIVGLVIMAFANIDAVIGYIGGSAMLYIFSYLEFRAMWNEISAEDEDD